MIGMRSVETLVVARAVAIILVVANHANFGVSLHGGLNSLLVISGLSLARFSFGNVTADVLRAMLRIALRIAIPSFLLALVWQILVRNISFPELAFYSNWLYKSRVALFPIWYAQAFTQVLVVLSLIFIISDLGARIAKRPLFWTGLAYVFAIAVALTSFAIWDTSYYADKLPHLIAWNFVFGWLVWAVPGKAFGIGGRLALTSVLWLSSGLLFVAVGADNGPVRAFSMALIITPVIWLDRIAMPSFLARFAIVASQATLFIFLFHYYAFWFIWRVGRSIGLEPESENPVLRLLAGVVGPIVLWALWTAAARVYRRGYRFLKAKAPEGVRSAHAKPNVRGISAPSGRST